MAPSIERVDRVCNNNNNNDIRGPHSKKNVTYAINYEESVIFWHSSVKAARDSTLHTNRANVKGDVENNTPNEARSDKNTATEEKIEWEFDRNTSNDDSNNNNGNCNNSIGNNSGDSTTCSRGVDSHSQDNTTTSTPPSEENSRNGKAVVKNSAINTASSTSSSSRRSNRELKKKEAPVHRTRVKYDMEQVPYVPRNRLFLQSFPSWPRRDKDTFSTSSTCSACALRPRPAPFDPDTSVVWVPSKRAEWDDSVPEMTAVCTSAAMRRHTGPEPFLPPLSKIYIRDRIDIDDPLNGYQIRHRKGGWLQGFVLWTNFTTWTHFFKWDSLDPVSGLPDSKLTGPMDVDGSLSKKLEAEPRSGDPMGGGIVFETIAEVGLLGGLGCGEYLLRMALDAVLEYPQYKFLVLQATDGSRSFYERFGFRRVGAVCRYGTAHDGPAGIPTEDSPLVGYRHWTHANESETSLQLHGGPSYMMCLELPDRTETSSCEGCLSRPSLLDEMKHLMVDDKPQVETLGATTTPASKKKVVKRRGSFDSPKTPTQTMSTVITGNLPDAPALSSYRKPENVGKTMMSNGTTMTPATRLSTAALRSPVVVSQGTKENPNLWYAIHYEDHNNITDTSKGAQRVLPTRRSTRERPSRPKRVFSKVDSNEKPIESSSNRDKRRKVESPSGPSEHVVAPPREGEAMSYAQKQYHSVWLAVPPQEKPVTRRPPRSRDSGIVDLVPSGLDGSNSTSQRSSSSLAIDSIAKSRPTRKSSRVSAAQSAAAEATAAASSRPEQVNSSSLSSSSRKRSGGGSQTKSAVSSAPKRPIPMNRSSLMKQKVKSYPRDRIHYYNKVVQLKDSKQQKFYFVLEYKESEGWIRIVPMEARGELSGKRQGRPRFQAMIEETDKNVLKVDAFSYEPVPAYMVMKTPYVAQEAWDIESAK